MKFCWLFTRKFIYCGSQRVTSVGNLVYRKQLHFKMYFYSLVLCFDRFHSVYKAALSRINWMYFKTTDLLFTSLMLPVFFSRLLLSLLSNTISFKSNLRLPKALGDTDRLTLTLINLSTSLSLWLSLTYTNSTENAFIFISRRHVWACCPTDLGRLNICCQNTNPDIFEQQSA